MKANIIKKITLFMLVGVAFVSTARAVVAEPPPLSASLCKGSGVVCKVSGPLVGGVPSTWDSEKNKDGSAVVIDL